MLHPDTEERTDPQLRLALRAERGAERAHQYRWRRRFATVAAVLAILVLALDGRVWAWTLAISGKGVCNTQTGQYDLAWTLDNTSEPEPASVTGDLTATVPAYGTKTVSESVPGSTSGSVSRTVRINWPSDQANLERTATVELTGDCKKPAPPTTTTPPTTNPPPDDDKDEDFAGTATDQSRTPPDQNGTPTEEEKKGPPVTRPAPNQLPFTGPQDLLLPAGSLLVFTGALLLVASSRRRYRLLPVAVRAVERALRKPYTGPRERL